MPACDTKYSIKPGIWSQSSSTSPHHRISSRLALLSTISYIISYLCLIESTRNTLLAVAQDLKLPPHESIKPPTGENDIPDGCEACKLLVKSFDGGLERTMRGKHEGGDTYWEEKNLKSYADSEVRLVEIQEQLCDELSKGKAQCLSIAEESETDIEDWWFKHRNKNIRLHDYLCIQKLKKCCPEETFGPTCSKCPSDCNKHGHCDGSGTRGGSGDCICKPGYLGLECSECEDNYYKMRTDTEEKFDCLKCHQSCRDTCNGPTSANCTECRSGYLRDEKTHLCIDINECELASNGMDNGDISLTSSNNNDNNNKVCPDGTFCINTDGHYKCSDCHRVCSSCVEYGRDKCITCALDYEMNSQHQCVHFSELDMDLDELDGRYQEQLTYQLLTNPLIFMFLLLLARVLRRIYDNMVGANANPGEIIGRREFLMISCYLVVYFFQSRYFKQMLRDNTGKSVEPQTRDEQAMHAEHLAEL